MKPAVVVSVANMKARALVKLLTKFGFMQVEMPNTYEKVFQRQIFVKKTDGSNKAIPAWVRIYTSIAVGTNDLRKEGEDAIRIQAVNGQEAPLWNAKPTRRTKNWPQVLGRVKIRLRKAWVNGIRKYKEAMAESALPMSAPINMHDAGVQFIGPSEKQIKFYGKLTGKPFPEGTSKSQATVLIGAALSGNPNQGRRYSRYKHPGGEPTPNQYKFLARICGGQSYYAQFTQAKVTRQEATELLSTLVSGKYRDAQAQAVVVNFLHRKNGVL